MIKIYDNRRVLSSFHELKTLQLGCPPFVGRVNTFALRGGPILATITILSLETAQPLRATPFGWLQHLF